MLREKSKYYIESTNYYGVPMYFLFEKRWWWFPAIPLFCSSVLEIVLKDFEQRLNGG